MRILEFWFDFASTYSYLSAMRLSPLAVVANIRIAYKPFLLGPIFKAQGWDTSPFQLYPAKGRYMVRDIERTAADRGLSFHVPSPFPAHSLHAARLALVGEDDGWIADFTRAVFRAEFEERRDIADKAVLADLISKLGLEPEPVLVRSGSAQIKDRLRQQTEQAAALGIFGAPTFRTAAGEFFWGDDRLEQAIAWAVR